MNLLILSGIASAINYIESLRGDPSLRLHVTDANPYCPGLYYPEIVPLLLPRARDTVAYRRELDRLIEDYAIDVLVPTSDYDVAAVLEYLHDGWNPRAVLFRPPFQAFRTLAHKGRLIERLTTRFPDNVPRNFSAVADPVSLPYPLVVKPTNESGGKGVSIVEDPVALAGAVDTLNRRFPGDFVIQEYIPGRTYIVSLVYDQQGAFVVGVAMRSILTFFTWGGGGCAGEVVEDPSLMALLRDIIEDAGGWCGPINLELRRDSRTGRFYVMEANCRLNGYSYLATMNGINLPRIVLSLLRGERPSAASLVPPNQRRQFVLGHRETLVSSWAAGNPAG